MIMELPHLDCVDLGSRGDVGLLHSGKGVEALAGEGVELVRVGLARLGDAGP